VLNAFRQKISATELARFLYGFTTRRTSGSVVLLGGREKVWCGDQDRMFLDQARESVADFDPFRYETEFECLSFFVSFAASLQELRPRTETALWEIFVNSWLETIANYRLALGMGGVLFIEGSAVGLDDLIQKRMERYSETSRESGVEGVAAEFSRLCCGLVNPTLERIGSSLYQERGAELILTLRSFRLVG